jgi:hypothetical protein
MGSRWSKFAIRPMLSWLNKPAVLGGVETCRTPA